MDGLQRVFALTVFVAFNLGTPSNASAASPTTNEAAEEVRTLMAASSVASAKSKLLACADAQVAPCQYMLAEWIERGELFERNQATARKLYELAYRSGYEPAGAAILRLAKEKTEEPGVSKGVTPTRPSIDLTSAAASLLESARGWPISAAPDHRTTTAPPVAGFRLGELDHLALASLQSADCDESATSVYRRCTGRAAGPLVEVPLTIAFFMARIDKVTFKGSTDAHCTALTTYANQTYGRPVGKLG